MKAEIDPRYMAFLKNVRSIKDVYQLENDRQIGEISESLKPVAPAYLAVAQLQFRK